MHPLVFFLVFVFGTLIGSFLNVVILRYNTGKNILGPRERSQCFSCAKKLEWYELVPVASFFCLRGKCLSCRTPISWQYPLVEILTGAIFVAIFQKFVWPEFVGSGFYGSGFVLGNISATTFLPAILYAVIWCILIVISVYDFRHKIIPNDLVYGFSALALMSSVLNAVLAPGPFSFSLLVSPILAGLIFFGFFAGLWFVSGGRWLGFGDAKLVLGVGFLLGLANGLSALTLAFWIGAVVSIALILFGKIMVAMADKKVVLFKRLRRRLPTHTMKSEIPFAPFIILGTLIAFFCSIDIFGTTQFLFM